ncbi:MAG: hypothetical protein J6D28_01855 [Bacilli bacterium]|nr:hypothetical protein [Bacilli bacterium]
MNCLFNKYRDIKMMVISVILILFLILLFVVVIFYKFDFNDSYIGIVRLEDDIYVYILIDDTNISKISNKQVVLDKKYLDCKIIKIDNEYTLTESGKKKGVYLKFDLDDSYKINNNVINVKFVDKKTIFDKFKEML